MNFDIKTLELFIRVAAVGAIGKAGSEFGLSSTAASQRIQMLESVVGAKLFHRTTRTVSLSSDGEVFLKHARKIIATAEEALAEVQDDPSAINGDLRIACSASFGRKHIAPYVAEFLETHPRVSINLDLSDEVVDFVEGGYDLGIRLGKLAPSTLKARKIASSPRVIVASPEYVARLGAPRVLDDLAQHNCLMRGDIKSWEIRTPAGNVVDIKVSGNYASNNAEAITEGALSGLGIARKCEWEIIEFLEAGRLVRILQDHTVTPEWNIFAVRAPSRVPPARVRVFTSFLENKLQHVAALRKKGAYPLFIPE